MHLRPSGLRPLATRLAFFALMAPSALWAAPAATTHPAPKAAPPAKATSPAVPHAPAPASKAPPAHAPAAAPAAGDEVADATVDSRMRRRGGQPVAAVVVLSNAAGRPFDAEVDRFLLRPLMPSLRAAPMSATHAAVVRVHGTAKSLHLPATLMAVGRHMQVPFVLVVEAMGKAHANQLFVGLVDVRAKKTLLAHRQPLASGHLDAAGGREAAAAVSEALAKVGVRPKAAPAHAPVPDVVAAAEAHRADKASGAAELEGEGAGKAHAPAKADAPAKHAHKERAGKEERAGEADRSLVRAVLSKARVHGGFQLMQRVSRLQTAKVNGIPPPCYCGNKSNAQPFFLTYTVGGELTSGMFLGDRRRPQDGIGIRADFMVAPVKTRVIRDGSISSVSSTVFGFDAGLFYRLAWFRNKTLTPDVRFGLGLHRFIFPLKNTQYTSVNYSGVDLNLGLDVPLHRHLGAFAGLDLRPGLKAGAQADRLLGAPKAGFGIGTQVGVRGGISRALFELAFRFDRYQVPYTGTTNLPDMPTSDGAEVQFQNVKLTDQTLTLMLRGGVAF